MTSEQEGTMLTPEAYVKLHQKAFRCAFDFLNTHFPPGEDPEWWKKTGIDASLTSASAGGGKLVNELLIGVMNYLEDEWKKRRQDDGETED